MEQLYISKKVNQIYKILPLYEQNENWRRNLQLLISELEGLYHTSILDEKQKAIITEILAKLSSLLQNETHHFFRKNIFDCISLLKEL